MCCVQDRAARGLINAAALHADQTVLDDVEDADAVLAAELVQLLDEGNGVQLLAVHSGRNALLEVDGNIGRLVRSHFRGNTQFEEARLVDRSLVGRKLKIQALMAQMPQVLILGVVGLLVDLQRDVVRLSVRDLLFAAVQLPETPRSDNVHLRCECMDRQLETNLIVALAGAAVADRVCAFLESNIYDALCDDRAREGSAEQVLLIGCARLDGRNDIVINKFLGQILDVQLGSAGLERLLLQTVQLSTLTDVAGNRDDLAAVMLLEPRDQYRSIQTAGICQNNFVIFLFHIV